MKKVLSVFVIAGMVALIACGPSAEEKAAKEKAKQDSIAKANKEKAMQDSIAAVEKAKADSIATAEKAKADSIAKAEEAKAKKGGTKGGTKTDPKKVKAGQGKG
jgi:hypothetical protein